MQGLQDCMKWCRLQCRRIGVDDGKKVVFLLVTNREAHMKSLSSTADSCGQRWTFGNGRFWRKAASHTQAASRD